MNLSMKQKQIHRHTEQTWLPRETWVEEGCLKLGVSKCRLLYTEWIDNKVLLYNTGNYI